MKAPKHRRQRSREPIEPPEGVNLAALARRASYAGSVEHKDAPSEAGWPRPRADAYICDRAWIGRFAEITRMLRQAIRSGAIGGPWEGDFPRYVWYKAADGSVYEARLINKASGQYKGYKLEEAERPKGM